MKSLRIACRNSRLSLVQAAIAKNYIQNAFPNQEVEIITVETTGDLNQATPLYQMQGRDFFSKEIDAYLHEGKADIAVHSMKDLSAERLNDEQFYGAVLERQLPHDVAIFSKSGVEKLKRNETITIGTSSLRRQELAPHFLKKALPFYNEMDANIDFKDIRGNVDTRLKKMQAGDYDGIILAAAGLNRLLSSPENIEYLKELLTDIKLMWLPLMEVPPAPAQGALLAVALATNNESVTILKAINDVNLYNILLSERNAVKDFGGGCHQQYGSIAIVYKQLQLINVVGIDTNGNDVGNIHFEPSLNLTEKKIFSTTDFMKNFFEYNFFDKEINIEEDVVFVSHHRAVTAPLVSILMNKRVFAAGSKTWLELARIGIWCEGCADGFGYDFMEGIFKSKLAAVLKDKVFILTNQQSAVAFLEKGLNAVGTYELVPAIDENLRKQLADAEIIFWTNFQQYETAKSILKKNVLHLCPAGKTADLLKKEGMDPVLFPTIKTFLAWRTKHIS